MIVLPKSKDSDTQKYGKVQLLASLEGMWDTGTFSVKVQGRIQHWDAGGGLGMYILSCLDSLAAFDITDHISFWTDFGGWKCGAVFPFSVVSSNGEWE